MTPTELTKLRQHVARGQTGINYDKTQIDTALEAVDDWFETKRSELNSLLETSAPGIFSTPVKKKIIKFWLQHKYGKE